MKPNEPQKTRRTPAFTLVEIMIVIAIIGLIAAIMMPNLAKARVHSQAVLCTEYLARIAGAKAQISFADHLSGTETPSDSAIIEYLEPNKGLTTINGASDLCPAGGVYTVNDIDTDPTCSLAANPGEHKLE